MKKLLVFAALTSFSLVTTAQEENVRFGAKAGINISNYGGDDYDGISPDLKTGFHLGMVAEIPVTDKFAFQPEVLYSTQGAKLEEKSTYFGIIGNFDVKSKLDYINVPLMAKYYIAQGLSLQAGPQIGFLVSAKLESENTLGTETEKIDEDIKKRFKSIDFGLNFGLGYQLDMGVFFDARYNLGLSDINDIKFEEGDKEFKIKNNVIQLSVGYKF